MSCCKLIYLALARGSKSGPIATRPLFDAAAARTGTTEPLIAPVRYPPAERHPAVSACARGFFNLSRLGKMIKQNFKPAALIVAAASLTPITLPAMAQSAPTGDNEGLVEEVFVLGKRRAYQGNFDDLEKPSADQIIDEDLLREAGVISLDDALDLSASVARQNNFGGLWNSFSVRGFSGDINLPSGFLVNGFNAGRGFAGPRDMVGIETVEVLKGPRSALFGRGEPGGTVNLITKRPQFETAGDVRATLGRWDQMRLEGDFQTVTGSEDQVGLRVVGFYEDAESFRDTVETEKMGFYPSITWDISELDQRDL